MDYKVRFEELDWQHPMKGVRHKFLDQSGARLRLVEYAREMAPHWCDRGHAGILLDGVMEIEYDSGKVRYEKGDALHIPAGEAHRHRAVILSETALCFFIEDGIL